MARGQSALEYLMTYGWALLIILIAAASLYSMGLLDPSTYTQSGCTGFNKLGYGDHFFDGTDFKLRVINEVGSKITLTNMSMFSNKNATCCWNSYESSTNLNAGSSTTITITGYGDEGWVEGDVYNVDVDIDYDIHRGITGHVEHATCNGKVE